MNLPISPWRRLLPLAGAACLVCAAAADTLEQVWAIAPDERPYVTAPTGRTERGVAISPVTKNVLLLSRAGSPQVYVLDGTDGSDGTAELGAPRTLSVTDVDGNAIIAGGTFALNLVGVADDGAVYACNLATSLGTVRIYRWADEDVATPISVAYTGDPLVDLPSPGSGQDIRFGDNFAVRGSGPGTQLVQTARNGKYILLYTTTDGVEFTPKVFVSPGTISGKIGIGVTFGDGNSIWATAPGQQLHHIALDPETAQATLVRSVPSTVVALSVTGLGYDPATQRLATADYTAHRLSVYDFSDPDAPTRIGEALAFPTANANPDGTAAASILGDDVVGLDTNNGLVAAKVEVSTVAEPPTIDTQPVGQTVLEGGSAQFGVVAAGTKPLTYQWRFNSGDLGGQTGSTLTRANVTLADAGDYSVIVKNTAGEAVSANATLTVVPVVRSDALTLKWKLAPGDKPWLNQDNTQRGLAYNPANGHVLVVSRTEGNKVYVLDGQTGAELHTLTVDPAIVFGGTFAVNLVGVGDDGAVYVCNLTTDSAASAFNIYRWVNDAADTLPELVYSGDPGGGRWGDAFDVRGSGTSTQVLAAQRNGKAVAVFTTTDNAQFNPTLITVEDATDGNFGLGAVFGEGTTFFGKATGQSLRHVSFDLAAGAGVTVANYATNFPGSVGPIAWDSVNNFLAGVTFENPDTIRLYDLADPENPTLIDQEFCAADNANINGTGQADFGGNMLFALNSNNGIVAYDVKKPTASAPPTLAEARVTGGNFEFTINGQAGATYGVQVTTDFKGWADVAGVTVAGPSGKASIPTTPGAAQFFRAVAK